MLPYWERRSSPTCATARWSCSRPTATRLRALVKHLDEISDDDIAGLNIPTGMPLIYELDEAFQPTSRGGRYLDPEAAGLPRRPSPRAAAA